MVRRGVGRDAGQALGGGRRGPAHDDQRVEDHHDAGEDEDGERTGHHGSEKRGRGLPRGGFGGTVHMDLYGGHPDVVHAGDREAHDEARAHAPQEPFGLSGGPQGGTGGGHGDDDRGGDGDGVVLDPSVQTHSGHAEVVHGGHAETGDGAPGEQGRPGGPPVADDEDAYAHHDDGDGETGEGHHAVVVDRRALDGEAHHRDEVHRPDAGAYGGRPEGEPAGPPGARSQAARVVQRSPSAPPRQAMR